MKSLPWPLPLRGPWTREMRTPLRRLLLEGLTKNQETTEA